MAAKETSFSEWLNQQIAGSGMTLREFGRRAGVSHATISNILGGQRGPGRNFLNAIAQVLEIPPDTVFRKAGFLPPIPGAEHDPTLGEILEVAKNLNPDDRLEVLDYALLRYRRRTVGERSGMPSTEAPDQAATRVSSGARPPPLQLPNIPTLDEEIESFIDEFPELSGIMAEAHELGLNEQAIRSVMSNVRLVTSSPKEILSFKRFYRQLSRMLEKLVETA